MKAIQHGVLLAAAFTFWGGAAHANCITGDIETWFELGNFCDEERDAVGIPKRSCAGWYFTQTKQNKLVRVPEVLFEVRDLADNFLTSGELDSNGHYSVCWAGSQATVKVVLRPEHESGAFGIDNSGGAGWIMPFERPGTGYILAWYGSDEAPEYLTSMYLTALTFYKNVVMNLDLTVGAFNGVSIRTDSGTTGTKGWDKIVKIDTSIPEKALGFRSIMHEMGHVVSQLASRNGTSGPGTISAEKGSGTKYDECGGDLSHDFFSSDECKDASFNEGLANFLAAAGVQSRTANNSCYSHAARGEGCHKRTSGVDRVDLDLDACPGGRVQESQVSQYLWDSYKAYPAGANALEPFDNIINAYPNGTTNRKKSENWCCVVGLLCVPCTGIDSHKHDDKNVNDWVNHGGNNALVGAHCM